jgi:hypothetical protein
MGTRLFLHEGTWGGKWARERGPNTFRDRLQGRGFDSSIVVWSLDVDGTPDIGPPLLGTRNTDWVAGGYADRYKMRGESYDRRRKLTHSYGLAPVLFQATHDDPDEPIVPIARVVAVCPPPRQELLDRARLALERGTIGKLFVIYADGWDLWARLGQVFDNHWGWRRDWSDLQGVRGFEQHGEKNVGHTGIFETAEWDRFDRNGAFDFLSEDVGAEPVLDDDDEEVLGV